MAKRASAQKPSAAKETADPLAESVDRLTAELRVLRQVIDEIREDFSWITRNGIPVQPIEHVHVKRMALDPLADDWNERLELKRSTFPSLVTASPLDCAALDRLAEELTQAFEAVAQGQLDVVLIALDGVRADLIAALKRRPAETTESPPTMPPPASPPSGRLF
ncbi:MAG TPA: hypothetical protein VM165_03525 [Planctomycetaceae bacterium]|nr:hypothetical protein [Planctomycetaceae bacterium]